MAAIAREVNISVKDMTVAKRDVPENTENKINLEYGMTIEIIKNEEVVEELTFKGQMRIEKRDEEWKVAWDNDEVPPGIMQ